MTPCCRSGPVVLQRWEQRTALQPTHCSPFSPKLDTLTLQPGRTRTPSPPKPHPAQPMACPPSPTGNMSSSPCPASPSTQSHHPAPSHDRCFPTLPLTVSHTHPTAPPCSSCPCSCPAPPGPPPPPPCGRTARAPTRSSAAAAAPGRAADPWPDAGTHQAGIRQAGR